MHVITWADYFDQPRPEHKWTLKQYLPHPSSTLLVGMPKSGKSTLATQIACAVAGGHTFMGQPSTKGPVFYLQCDVSDTTWCIQMDSFDKAGLQWRHENLYTLDPNDRVWHLDIRSHDTRVIFKHILDQCRPKLVIIDVMIKVHGGKEGDSHDMKIVGDFLMELFHEQTLILIHHPRKEDKERKDNPIEAGRGSTHIAGMVDNVWLLEPGMLKIVSRIAPEQHLHLVKGQGGLIHFPAFEGDSVVEEAILNICATHPHDTHKDLIPIAKECGISEPIFMSQTRKLKCIHFQASSIQPKTA